MGGGWRLTAPVNVLGARAWAWRFLPFRFFGLGRGACAGGP